MDDKAQEISLPFLNYVTTANKFVFGLIAFYGVAVFFVCSVMIIVSPIFSFLGHISLGETLVSISGFCQIWVFLPVTELMIYVTWKIVIAILENISEMKNHEILRFVTIMKEFSLRCFKENRVFLMYSSIIIQYLVFFFVSTCVILFTILEVRIAGYPLFAIMLYSVCFCLFKVFLIQFQCWRGLLTNNAEISELDTSCDNSFDDDLMNNAENIESSMVKLNLWHKYIDDPECNPFYALPFVKISVETTFMWSFSITIVFIMFLFCLFVNIKLLTERFSFAFLIGTIFFVYSAPFMLQFNFFKLFVKRSKFERHQEMKQMFIKTFAIVSTILFMIIIFIILINIPNQYFPQQLEYIPPVNPNVNSSKNRMSSICNDRFGEFDVFQMIGFSTLIYEIERNDTIFENTIKYLYGDTVQNLFSIQHINNTYPGKFSHMIHISSNTSIINIRGLHSAAEWVLVADLIGGYRIPELLYSHIPGFQIILPYVEQLMVEIFEFTRYMFDYRPLVTYYTDPLISYVESQHFQKTDKVFFVGHNNGGVFAKMLSMKFGHESFSVGGSSALSTSIQSLGIDPMKQQLITNLISEKDFLTTSDNQLGTNYIIPTVNAVFERNCMYTIFCMLSVGCNQTNRFENYCYQILGPERYGRMNKYFEGVD